MKNVEYIAEIEQPSGRVFTRAYSTEHSAIGYVCRLGLEGDAWTITMRDGDGQRVLAKGHIRCDRGLRIPVPSVADSGCRQGACE